MNKINFANLDLNLLRVLDRLLVERSTTRAAERLNLSQSAVSAALRRLRDVFGDPLFERKNNTLMPTPFALSLEPELRELLTRLETVLENSHGFSVDDCQRTFRLSASDYFADYLMPGLSAKISVHAPKAKIQLTPLDPHDHVNSLERFKTDAIIFLSSPIPAWMRSTDVLQSEFRIIACREHRALDASGILPNQVVPLDLYCELQHGLYSPSGETHTWVDIELGKLGKQRHITATTSTFHSLAKTISENQLLATVPALTALDMARHYPLNVYHHPLTGIKSTLMMAWHYRNDKKPEHEWFRTMVIDELATVQAHIKKLSDASN